jgi:hypothetical protein
MLAAKQDTPAKASEATGGQSGVELSNHTTTRRTRDRKQIDWSMQWRLANKARPTTPHSKDYITKL